MSAPPRKLTNSLRSTPPRTSSGRPRAQIALDRPARLPAERHDPLLRALAVRADEAAADVDVAELEPDRLRGPQAAAVHDLEQRAVAKLDRIRAPRAVEQPRHLGLAEHVWELAALRRRVEGRRRVVGDQLLAAQVAVERAQAGGLAADRRRRARRPPGVAFGVRGRSGREVGEEVGDVGALDRDRVAPARMQEGAELEQIGPVGVERVAGETALELEVGEKVEHQRLEVGIGARLWLGDGDRHGAWFLAAGRRTLPVQRPLARSRSPAELHGRLQQQHPDQRLRVLALADRAVELGQRPGDDLDPLVGVRPWSGIGSSPVARNSVTCSWAKPGVV